MVVEMAFADIRIVMLRNAVMGTLLRALELMLGVGIVSIGHFGELVTGVRVDMTYKSNWPPLLLQNTARGWKD